MHYGVYLDTVGPFCDPRLLAELAHEAEEEGWEGAFISDQMGQPPAAADPWIALTAMAMRTERIRLGPIVTPIARRRPWKLARETVTLDRLSGGRITLGVGLGYSEDEFEAFGESGDPRTRAEKLDEGLEILVGLWSGKPYSFSGKHYRLSDVCMLPPPVQKPRIPIWAAGAWTRNRAPFRRAARWDGVVAIADPKLNRAISPDEVMAIRAYLTRHQPAPRPLDIVVILWSQGREPEATQAYTESGVTWWLEDLSTDRYTSVAQARKRLSEGPPGDL